MFWLLVLRDTLGFYVHYAFLVVLSCHRKNF